MPKKYTPSSLKEPVKPTRPLAYGIGIKTGEHSYGMIEGPFPNEVDALECVPPDDEALIIRFNANGTEDIIWKWDETEWIKIDPPDQA